MKILKVLLSVVILTLLVFMFFVGKFTMSEGKHLIDPYIDTHFAPDYSPDKFDKIKTGMTLGEVKSIIGEPLYFDTVYNNASKKIKYVYTGDGKLLNKMREQGKRYYYDCAWYRSYVLFDENNIVVEINKGWSYD